MHGALEAVLTIQQRSQAVLSCGNEVWAVEARHTQVEQLKDMTGYASHVELLRPDIKDCFVWDSKLHCAGSGLPFT